MEEVARFVVVGDASRGTFDTLELVEDQMADQGRLACPMVKFVLLCEDHAVCSYCGDLHLVVVLGIARVCRWIQVLAYDASNEGM